jgi:hypothetical protein
MASLNSTVETALKAIIDDEGSPPVANVYTGADDDTRQIPCAIVECDGGEEILPDSGNYSCRAKVTVKSTADNDAGATNALTTHNSLAESVIDLFKTDDLATTLSAKVSAFTVIGVIDRGQTSATDGRTFEDSIEFDLIACLSGL